MIKTNELLRIGTTTLDAETRNPFLLNGLMKVTLLNLMMSILNNNLTADTLLRFIQLFIMVLSQCESVALHYTSH